MAPGFLPVLSSEIDFILMITPEAASTEYNTSTNIHFAGRYTLYKKWCCNKKDAIFANRFIR